MKQSLKWSEENTISVLYLLLMEQDYMTQDQIKDLTGLSRTAVSEALRNLTENTSLPILQTRKSDSKKNYYYSPFSFDQYTKNYLLQSIQTTISNLKVIPIFLHRLNSINDDSVEKKQLENYLQINLFVTYYYSKLSVDLNSLWDKLQENSNYKLTITNEFLISEINIEDLVQKASKKMNPIKNDSLRKIKRDFVEYAKDSQTVYGRSRELTAISHVLIIEPNPITQDYLIEFTNYGRSTVSEALSKLVKLGSVEIVKKPKDRKKYYKVKYSLLDYVINRSKASLIAIEMIILMLNENFIRRILSLNINDKIKKKYCDFFTLNIKSFKILSEIIELYFTAIYDKLNAMV